MNRTSNLKKRMVAVAMILLLLMSMVSPAQAETFSAVVTSGSMAVYENSTLSVQTDVLLKNTVVQVLSYSGNTANITYSGKTGYASTADMTPVNSIARKAVTKSGAFVYRTASTKAQSVKVKTGLDVYVLATSGSWAMVERSGVVGYMKLSALTYTEEKDDTPSETGVAGTVNTAKLPVYKTASTKSTKLGTLKYGQVVNVLSWDKSWAHIELDGKRGYCAVKGLIKGTQPDPTPTPAPFERYIGVVTSATLPVYKSASLSAKVLGTMKQGQTLTVHSVSGGWAYVELNGKYGYCAVTALSKTGNTAAPVPTATPEPSVENAVEAVVSAKSVTVYRLASETSAVLGTLTKGKEVNVLRINGEWAYIERGGNYGFCKVDGLTQNVSKKTLSGYTQGGFTASVIYPGARAYASASTSAASVGLTLGATVNVYAYNSEWACLVNGNEYAFVPVKQLSRATYSTVSGSGSALQTLLKALLSYGYYDGVPSTNYNSAAATAIKRFQEACGLEETGVADQTLQRILYGGYAPASSILSATLSGGSSGANVTRLQTRLYALGYLSKTSSVDGDYGSTTSGAVSLFQSANGISATGIADKTTLKAIYSTTAVKKASSAKAADEAAVITPAGTVKLSSTYVTTMPAALKSTTTGYSSGSSNAQKLEYVIYSAQEKLGCPYVYGATGPSKFDCSGLTTYAFKKIGVSLKRSAYAQGYDSSYTKITGTGSLKRGDLVFFNTVSDSDLSDHVGIYLGGGCFIHASSGGHKVVVSNLTSGYYNRVFSWGRRVL